MEMSPSLQPWGVVRSRPAGVPNRAVMASGDARRMRTQDKKKLAGATRFP